MATRGHLKSVEFKQAALAMSSTNLIAEPSAATLATANANATVALNPSDVLRHRAAATPRIAAIPASPVAAAAARGTPAPPRFTAEESILLRGLASGASSKEMAAQMRLPRESLYRLIGDLRRKTGAASDTALAVWVLRNMGAGGVERRGGSGR
jgi:DNA-binding CsgD family transcriptional regulator